MVGLNQGFEPKVIQGAKKVLESRLVELLAMEIKPTMAKADKVMIVNAICNAGYDLTCTWMEDMRTLVTSW